VHDGAPGLNSTAFVRSSVSVTGHWSCPAEGWRPHTSSIIWSLGANGLFLGNASTVYCPVFLPDGAVVTAARFGVRDTTASYEVVSCAFTRRTYAEPSDPTLDTWQTAAGTGDAPFPGTTTLTVDPQDTIISNDTYAYYVECVLEAHAGISVMQAEIDYTATGGLAP